MVEAFAEIEDELMTSMKIFNTGTREIESDKFNPETKNVSIKTFKSSTAIFVLAILGQATLVSSLSIFARLSMKGFTA